MNRNKLQKDFWLWNEEMFKALSFSAFINCTSNGTFLSLK